MNSLDQWYHIQFQIQGRGFESQFNYMKKILPRRILISSDFEPLCDLLWGLDGHLLGKLLFIQIHFGVLWNMKVGMKNLVKNARSLTFHHFSGQA